MKCNGKDCVYWNEDDFHPSYYYCSINRATLPKEGYKTYECKIWESIEEDKKALEVKIQFANWLYEEGGSEDD